MWNALTSRTQPASRTQPSSTQPSSSTQPTSRTQPISRASLRRASRWRDLAGLRVLVACLALVLFATACGGSSDEESVVAAETVEETDAAAGGDEDAGDDDDQADSDEAAAGDGSETLEGLLGPAIRLVRGAGAGAGGQFNADPEAIIEQQRQIEEAIRSCMLAQGFEYTMADVAVDPLRCAPQRRSRSTRHHRVRRRPQPGTPRRHEPGRSRRVGDRP